MDLSVEIVRGRAVRDPTPEDADADGGVAVDPLTGWVDADVAAADADADDAGLMVDFFFDDDGSARVLSRE